MEKTFVIIKPLGLQNFLVQIMGALRKVGTVVERKLVAVSRDQIAAHYAEHSEKAFFQRLLEYYEGETVLILVLEGPDAIARVRAVVGPSDPRKSDASQIRHLVMTRWQDGQKGWSKIELATSGVDNLIHASDSPDAAVREIALWFPES